MTRNTKRVIFGRSHLSRDREDFRTDYDPKWSREDEREYEDHDRDCDYPEVEDDGN